MKVGHLNVTRRDYYDREASIIVRSSWQQGLGGHGVTLRWSYTPPSGRQGFVGTMAVGVWPDTVGALGGVERFAIITVNGFTANEAVLRASVFDSNSYASDHAEMGTNLVITSGTLLLGLDYAGAALPTADYLESLMVSEFTSY